MNKQRSFEELDQRWSDLPLPDADAAWRDMSAQLDKEERKRTGPPLPPFLLSGCAGWMLLFAVLSVGAFVVFRHYAATPPASPVATLQTPVAASRLNQSSRQNQLPPKPGQPAPSSAVATLSPRTGDTAASVDRQQPHPLTPAPAAGSNRAASEARHTAAGDAAVTHADGPAGFLPDERRTNTAGRAVAAGQAPKSSGGTVARARRPATRAAAKIQTASTAGNGVTSPAAPSQAIGSTIVGTALTGQPVAAAPPAPAAAADSAKRMTPPLPAGDSATNTAATAPKPKRARRSWRLSAGAGISQAIAVGGQQSSGDGYNGRASLLGEHVPSLWLRAHKGRWFVQAEARFNAPQLLPAFAFAQKTRFDTAAYALRTERQQLRKAWYHQFPLTVNYAITPHWSAGLGAQWSVLYRAAGERRTDSRSLSNSTVTKDVSTFQIPGYRDSFLYKSQWQLVLQTEVGWRRWGLGLRYRADLEPYIRYTKPEGEVVDARNNAFEATLRFRLWESKKRK